jgi:putative ABC transport system permease protein
VTLGTVLFRDLGRNPLRLVLTVLAATVGVLAFIFLQTVIDLWYSGVESAQPDRIAVRNRTSLTQPLPLSYFRRIAAIPGVTAVTHGGWFGGTLGDRREDFFPNFYVDAPTYLRVYDEFLTSDAEVAAWLSDPCGAMIGRQLANRFGWAPGDRVSLKGTIFPGTWDFTVRGIYDGKTASTDTTGLVFGYRCLNERVPESRRDLVGYYAVRVDDPARSAAVGQEIDALFANSAYETKSESERAFQLGFVAMSSAILSAVRIVSYVILVIILLILANTIAMGVRDKTVDISTLRAIGFRPRHVVGLVLAESALIGVIAAGLGIAASPLVVRAFVAIVSKSFGSLPAPVLSPSTLAFAGGASLLVGLAAGALPAIRAGRLPVAEGLRRVA